MHKIVMVLGAVTAFAGVMFFVLILLVGRDQPGTAMLSGLVAGGGLIVSGAILYSFGAIVEHLVAIRRNTEAQLKIFGDRLGNGAP